MNGCVICGIVMEAMRNMGDITRVLNHGILELEGLVLVLKLELELELVKVRVMVVWTNEIRKKVKESAECMIIHIFIS